MGWAVLVGALRGNRRVRTLRPCAAAAASLQRGTWAHRVTAQRGDAVPSQPLPSPIRVTDCISNSGPAGRRALIR